jgi:biopolymer transport protein TolQ
MPETQSGQVVETLAYSKSASLSLFQLFLGAEPVVQIIMIGLLVASIMSWAIIFDRILRLRKVRQSLLNFEKLFWKKDNPFKPLEIAEQTPSVCVKLIKSIHHEMVLQSQSTNHDKSFYEQRVEKIFGTFIRQEIATVSKHLDFLATVGSVSLFVGLFGTVWGIIHSFQSIAASKNTSLAVVAPGIAEALLATALGLIVAIPAVVAYNKLSSLVNAYAEALENFADRLVLSSSQKLFLENGYEAK